MFNFCQSDIHGTRLFFRSGDVGGEKNVNRADLCVKTIDAIAPCLVRICTYVVNR